jgi:hypothetical protein
MEKRMPSLGLVNSKRRLPAGSEASILSFGFAFAMTVFYVDTFTDIHSALATLYVITLLLSAETLTEKGALLLTAACVGLSAFSYVVARGLQGGCWKRVMVH